MALKNITLNVFDVELTLADLTRRSIGSSRMENSINLDPLYIPIVLMESYGRSSLGYLLVPPKGQGWYIRLYGWYGDSAWAEKIENETPIEFISDGDDENSISIEDILSQQFPDFKYTTASGDDNEMNEILISGNYPIQKSRKAMDDGILRCLEDILDDDWGLYFI